MNETPPSGAAAESARVPTAPQTPAARARKSAPAAATPAPHPAVSILDKLGELVAILGFLFLGYHRVLDGGQTIGSVLGVVGLNLGLRKIGDKIAGHGHGLGVVGLLVAGASGYGAHVVHGLRVVLPGLLGAFLLLNLSGCAAIQKNAGPIETGVSIASAAEDALCGHGLDAWVGPVGPINPDAPTDNLPAVVGQIRSGVCNDDMRGLLERARELIRAAVRAAAAAVAPPTATSPPSTSRSAAPSSAPRSPPSPTSADTPDASPPPTTPPEPAAAEVDAPPPVTP
jgi:hypothetical protein